MGLPWGINLRGLQRGSSGIFNVVFCVVPDLRKASKGEEVTVGVALIASAIVSPFQGLA